MGERSDSIHFYHLHFLIFFFSTPFCRRGGRQIRFNQFLVFFCFLFSCFLSQVMLYKTRGFFGESAVSDVACPITGRWRFTCNHDEIEDTNKTKPTILIADSNRGDQLASCASPASRASDCPTGRNIDLRFQVSFNGNQDSQFSFLGFSISIPRVFKFHFQDSQFPFPGLQLSKP